MIPKIVHYIWFGRNPYNEKIKDCMKSWQEYLPEYEFKLWNEETFDIDNSCDFVKEAFANKKWAFVSDYVRVWALNKFGGVYLDTDIEVCQPLDKFLDKRMVLGTDELGHLTAFMASEPEQPLWIELLDSYHSTPFLLTDGTFNQKVNNLYIEDLLAERGYKVENKNQRIEEGIEIYSDEWFHAVDHMTGDSHITADTHTIHWHTLTWCPRSTRVNRYVRVNILRKIFGGKMATKIFLAFARKRKTVKQKG
ncbi:MAG: glycosyl transferase [Muribaculaceae bacterium]|nr:glycosyl transferase [Muribaculaceae bacterium]